MQAVVDTGAKIRDGDIIIGLAPAWSKIIGILQKDPSAAFQISPRKWEEIIAGAYEEAGFDRVILTPRSGDLGRDVIAEKHGYWSIRIIDQVKAYGPNHLVPANDVRALVGVLQMDHTATKGVVTTTSNFAPRIADDPTIAPLLPFRLELIDGQELLKRLSDIAGGLRA